MESLKNNPKFLADYERLKQVRMDASRHATSTAYDHCELVANRVAQLATLNECTIEGVSVLVNLAYAHELRRLVPAGRRFVESVDKLPIYGITDPRFADLVRYQAVVLAWFKQQPSDQAWRKLGTKVDLRLLCLFLVADRVDSPNGWEADQSLSWFLDEVESRRLLDKRVLLDAGPKLESAGFTMEVSAGGALIRGHESQAELLVMRTQEANYELPKGHLERDETPAEAAARELREETGLISEPQAIGHLGLLRYSYSRRGEVVEKEVHYYRFTCFATEVPLLGERPSDVRELRWIKEEEVHDLPLVNEELRPILAAAFASPLAPFAAMQWDKSHAAPLTISNDGRTLSYGTDQDFAWLGAQTTARLTDHIFTWDFQIDSLAERQLGIGIMLDPPDWGFFGYLGAGENAWAYDPFNGAVVTETKAIHSGLPRIRERGVVTAHVDLKHKSECVFIVDGIQLPAISLPKWAVVIPAASLLAKGQSVTLTNFQVLA